MSLQPFFEVQPYALDREAKAGLLLSRLRELTARHYEACPPYRRMLEALDQTPDRPAQSPAGLPFIPVSLFKDMDLRSVPADQVVKTMTSSGTTGQAVSRIYLDRDTAAAQQKVLAKIVAAFTGTARRPMLIIDSPSVLKDRAQFSARGAGILGFSIFGSDRVYALGEDMAPDLPAIEAFLAKHQGRDLLLFGFTFIIWRHLVQALRESGRKLDLSRGLLIHGGGWKKMAAEAVSPRDFKRGLAETVGLTRVHDYYGLVEQTGGIYLECEEGHLHASVFSDIITRRAADFSACGFGEPGLVQVLSALPESYPGHSLLTEDEGVILGEDDCPCGRRGKYFHLLGRIKNAEIRGCSDTYAAS